MAEPRRALILDVDTGIDDSLAILYALGSAQAELLAVTCVSGNVEARQVARNTLGLLELAGRADIEVALGREVPLVRPLQTAPETHGPEGIGYAILPAPERALSDRHAADLLVEEARRRPGEVTLVTLGPLTNLAVALTREPALPSLLGGLVMMAGSYRSAGNTAPTTEWNVAVDPEAMAVVLAAWAAYPELPRPLALGLDVTERAKLTPGRLATLYERAGTPDEVPLMRFVDDALRFYMDFHSRYDGFYGAFIHDALAVAAALDADLVRSEALAVEVELEGRWTTGETVTDWRRQWGRPTNLDVVVDARIEGFFERFVDRLATSAAGLSSTD
ncbi:MAG TPA: nucleoside hydrolase [Candidatus Limnocylindrales bacterium]|jgi:purine nucleosidase|nr:nucleoside hydrolase [Candidatus Limnocylindrales bacterium]